VSKLYFIADPNRALAEQADDPIGAISHQQSAISQTRRPAGARPPEAAS
jgi:hypothetical protein